MKLLVAFVLVSGAVAWGIFGGDPVELRPGGKMPQQLSQLTR